MTTAQYLSALRKLGLTPASKATAAALGLSGRHCRRLAAGAKIPKTVELLLRCLVLMRLDYMGKIDPIGDFPIGE